jgi:hypothetical protein
MYDYFITQFQDVDKLKLIIKRIYFIKYSEIQISNTVIIIMFVSS